MKAILEKISHDRNRSFSLFDFQSRRFDCPFHHHPEIELTLIIASSGLRYVGDHISRFSPGDLVLMGPNLPHMYINDATPSGQAHSIVMQFLPECLGSNFFQLGELKAIHRLFERARVGLSFHGLTRDKVAPLMVQLDSLNGAARLTAFLNIFDILAGSKEFRVLASPTYSPSLALYQGERINRVCELISKKFREGITQNEAARIAHMSPPSFSRFFRRATNKTFRAFLNEVRIGHASHLLLETERTVAEVCYDSGFGNLSNFNRQFLKLRKVSPRAYRRKRPQEG
ncbi:MAG: AraC family transcriptional regulator [Methylacidiphilales bacterium]|nr:AraC family transcriptional regulator [Candidatus Methylacidiphilales bacterium]